MVGFGANVFGENNEATATTSISIPKLTSIQEGERLKLLNQLSKDRSNLQTKLLSQLDESNPKEVTFGIAYLLGVYRMDQAVRHLSKYIALKNEQSDLVKRLPLYGEYPIVEALIRIGNPAIPAMIENIESSDDENVRKLSARVIRYIDGTEIANFRLAKRMENESDPIKKARLIAAMESIRK
jgi:HEAT repeat protein